jgi:hypothetical protein
VLFGSETPTGSSRYARLEGDPRLFTVFSYVKSSFDKTVFDLRDKKLLAVDGQKISRVKLNTGGRAIEFGQTPGSSWQIVQPRALRADNFTVGDLVRSVQDAELVSIVDNPEELAPKPDFAKPYATVEVVDEAGAHTLTIAKAADKYYARSTDLAGVFEVSSALAEGLDKELDEFRNKKLFDFGFSEIAKLTVRDGGNALNIEKKDDKWLLASEGGRELDSAKVQTLIDSLRNLTAIEFTSDDAAGKAKFGLNAPALEALVTMVAGASEEKVAITSPANEKVYAAREGQPSTYQVEKSAAEEIQRAVADLLKPKEGSGEGSAKDSGAHFTPNSDLGPAGVDTATVANLPQAEKTSTASRPPRPGWRFDPRGVPILLEQPPQQNQKTGKP